jgi:signal transduction histidine kinase
MVRSGKAKRDESSLTSSPVSSEILFTILDSLDGIVYIAHIETNLILFANSYLKKIFGFDPTGRNWRHLICNSQDSSSNSVLFDNSKLFDADGNPCSSYQWEYQNPFNKKWYSAKTRAIEWTDGSYVRLEIGLDITEHKQMYSFLNEARNQAENAINTKNRFVALVAHDLKSPFVSILGMLHRILKKETFVYEVHRKFLENIIVNGQRMLKMIDNLLDMDRLETGKIKPEPCYFDVSEMICDVFENFSHLAAQKKLNLVNKVPHNTELYADKYLYFVVLNNLISNAVKFSFFGGNIEVSIDSGKEQTRLMVRDEGKGIPVNYINDIFKPDVKTTSRGTSGETGSGLGLVFCQQIMKAHGGSIVIDSCEGHGAIFYVELGSSCRFSGYSPEGSETKESD